MRGPLPTTYLQPDEPVLLEGHCHKHAFSLGLSLLGALSGLMALGGILLLTLANLTSVGIYLALALILGGLLLFGIPGFRAMVTVRTSQYTVTPTRVYSSRGYLAYKIAQTTYDKVTDLEIHQGIIGRRLNFGTVTLQTAGRSVSLQAVPQPFEFKQGIEEARNAYFLKILKRKGPSKTRAQATEAEAPRKIGKGDLLYEGHPEWIAFLGNFVTAAVFVLGGLLVGLVTGFTLSGFFLLMIPAGFVLGGTSLVGAWIRVRYTTYQVLEGGVIVTSGWLTRRRVEATYAKITDVTVSQDVFGKILGFGNIQLNTAGSNEAPVQFLGIKDPDALRERIDEARGQA